MITFLSSKIYSQEKYSDDQFLPNLNPVTPEVWKFLKYDEIPVSNYTGTANISVPIYTIKNGDISVPISLQYNSRGVKVTDEAGWVGLNWDLEFGSITQVVQGKNDLRSIVKNHELPDFFASGESRVKLFLESNLVNGNKINSPYHSLYRFKNHYVPFNKNFVEKRVYSEPISSAQTYDTEPDIFKANFFGHSINILLNKKRGNQPVVLDKNGYKVILVGSEGNHRWEITDPNGITYYFNEITEVESNSSYAINQGDHKFIEFGNSISNVNNPFITYVWRPTKIVDSKGFEVSFNYTDKIILNDYSEEHAYELFKGTSSPLGHNINIEKFSSPTLLRPGVSTGNEATYFRTSIKNITTTETSKSYLSSITFKTPGSSINLGEVTFTLSDRDTQDYGNAKQLNSIAVRNYKGGLVQEVSFGYGYFISSPSTTVYVADNSFSNTRNNNRLKLENISFLDEGKYEFDYFSINLPPKNSFKTDVFGYYNGQNNTSLVPNPYRFYPNSKFENLQELTSEDINIGNNKSTNADYITAASLKSITFPTSGKIEFEYEPHIFSSNLFNIKIPNQNQDSYNSNLSESIGGGLRVKKQKIYFNDNDFLEYTYQYEGGKLSSGIKYLSEIIDSYTNKISGQFYNYNYSGIKVSSTNNNTSSPVSGNSIIGYDKVIVRKKSNDNTLLNGYTEYYYTNELETKYASSNTLFSFASYLGYTKPKNGSLLSEKVFNNNNDLLKEKILTYSNKEFDEDRFYYGVKRVPYGLSGFITFLEGKYSIINQSFDIVLGYYPLYYPVTQLVSEKEVYYKNGSNYSNLKEYTYEDTYDKIRSVKLNDEIEVVYSYTFDYTEPNDIKVKFATENIFNEVVRQDYYKDNNLIESRDNEYKILYDNVLLSKVRLRENHPYKYNDKIIFDTYDVKSQLLSYTGSDGIKTVILRDNYNNIVALIKGAKYESNQIISEINENQILTSSEISTIKSNPTEANLGIIYENLGTCFIETYRLKPLIGLEYYYDQNFQSKKYQYDGQNRVRAIYDKDLKVISAFEYKYANSTNN
ncbi:hypothetical protein AVL50_19260 [Flammeovirga sp. SJP92]|nr:hypothetical protein AVL50_19260 [Flammeovirga sp. SJP92]